MEFIRHYTTTGLWFHLWKLSPRLELRTMAGHRSCSRREDYSRCCHLFDVSGKNYY